jgi:hypothetical protein
MAISAAEQYMLELINRTREDPKAELDRLLAASATNAVIAQNLTFFRVNLTELRNEFNVPFLSNGRPLAWNPVLAGAALGHSRLMEQNKLAIPVHQLQGEPDLTTRLRNAGYLQPNLGFEIAENLPAILTDILAAHASMVIDWGTNPDGSPSLDGMEPGRGHRVNMLTHNLPFPCDPSQTLTVTYDEIGISIVNGTGSLASTMYITQDFGFRCDRDLGHGYMVGVVFRDVNGDGLYSMGSGVGGATLNFVGVHGHHPATTTTNPFGGYQILLPGGDYGVSVNGIFQGSMPITGRINTRWNFVVP